MSTSGIEKTIIKGIINLAQIILYIIMKLRNLILEQTNEIINIGDNTNYGEILDKTENQFFVKNNNFPKGSWIHKSLVKKTDIKNTEPMINKGWISPHYVISAFKNVILPEKIKKYSDEMSVDMLEHNFPPIKGYPIFIDTNDIKRYEEFIDDNLITKKDLGRYAWVVTDGHHRTLAALQAGIPKLKTELDYSYVDEKDFI